MSWFNNKIAKVFPGYALRREVATRRLKRLQDFDGKESLRRSFEAISGNRLRSDFLSTSKSADSAIQGSIDGLRNHIRQLEYNNGFVSGPIQRIVKNVVGQGIHFQARVKSDIKNLPKISEPAAEKFNTNMERLFKRWTQRSDTRLMQNFNEQQAIVEGGLVRDGEVLAVGRNSKRKDRQIPYCLELLEADRLQTPSSEISNPKIRNGILFDDEGAPKTYFILKRHPGEAIPLMGGKAADFEEVPAFNANGTRKVLHLFNPLRPEQTRGFSSFAAALKDIQDLDRYTEAEKMAALEDACMTGFVKTEAPTAFQEAYTDASGNPKEYERVHEFAPLKWHYLRPGEDITMHKPTRPNDSFSEMVNQLLRGPSNALDIPPEVMSQNWQGMNYSNARTVLLMFYLSCRIRQKYLIDHFCIPIYENVATALVVKGLIKAPGFDMRREDYLSHSWIAPGWQWIDPVKEAKGKEIEVQNNFETLTDIHAAQGRDFEETMETRAIELKKMKELEEKYDIQFPKNQGGKSFGNGAPEDEKEEEEERAIRIVK